MEIIRRFWFLGLIAIISLGAFVFRDRLPGAADELQVGDCIDLPAEGQQFEDVQHHPCTDPHLGEVYVIVEMADADTIPADSAFEAFATTQCLGQAFVDYTGLTFEAAAEIDAGFFYPTTEAWNDGDRTVTCYLTPVDGQPVTVSYKKAS